MQIKKIKLTATLLVLPIGLIACASTPEIKSAEEMFADAITFEEVADYQAAINMYNEIQATYPFGNYAQQSMLNLAFLHYKEGDYDEALSVINRFIQEFPAHESLDYARYLRALSLQREQPDVIDKILFEDFKNHSTSSALEAYNAFLELVELHPLSKYVPDSIERAEKIIHSLAIGEVQTAIHYLRIGAYSASLRRASNMINTYPESKLTEPALAIMIASLVEMKATTPLEDTLIALQTSYPDSTYLVPAQNGAHSLLESLGEDITRGDYFTKLIE